MRSIPQGVVAVGCSHDKDNTIEWHFSPMKRKRHCLKNDGASTAEHKATCPSNALKRLK
jgi:hypothetical protein